MSLSKVVRNTPIFSCSGIEGDMEITTSLNELGLVCLTVVPVTLSIICSLCTFVHRLQNGARTQLSNCNIFIPAPNKTPLSVREEHLPKPSGVTSESGNNRSFPEDHIDGFTLVLDVTSLIISV